MPDAAVGLSVAAPAATTFVRVGGAASVPVTVTRDGVVGDITVTATTSAEGVSFDALTIPAGTNEGSLTVRAGAEAPFVRFDVGIKAVVGTAEATTTAAASIIGLPGNTDATFGSAGEVQFPEDFVPSGAFLGADQSVMSSRSRLIRISDTGVVDERFGVRGAVVVSPQASGLSTASIEAVSVTPSGRFLLAGHGTRINEVDLGVFVVAVTSSGQPDPTRPPAELFGTEETNDTVLASAAGPDESLYLLVSQAPPGASGQTVVVRVRSSGELDGVFGRVAVEGGGRLVARANGDVLRYGDSVAIDCVTTEGALSSMFGARGTVMLTGYSRIHDVTPLPDGRLIVTGTDGHSMQLTRLLADGRLDEAFGEQGTLKFGAASEYQEYGVRLWIAPDGSAYGAGYTDQTSPYLHRLRFFHVTAAGAIDTAYGSGGATVDTFQWDEITSVTFGEDHRAIVTGLSYEARGVPSRRVARRYWF